ncbi:MAG: helix-turn-helix domain-containing protein [Acidimicrobiia bacterium]
MPAGARAAALRRELGPVAWCALECLIERSDDGRTTAATVRAVATDLGVAKNTAHRAVATLTRAGLVEPVQTRDRNGKFRPGHYQLHLCNLLVATPRARSHRAPTSPHRQLSLLPRS